VNEGRGRRRGGKKDMKKGRRGGKIGRKGKIGRDGSRGDRVCGDCNCSSASWVVSLGEGIE
jgi:hypothetical protein